MYVCRDCKSASPVKSLIPVDALHMQCPICLYVFFLETPSRNS
jgi:rubredoxin